MEKIVLFEMRIKLTQLPLALVALQVATTVLLSADLAAAQSPSPSPSPTYTPAASPSPRPSSSGGHEDAPSSSAPAPAPADGILYDDFEDGVVDASKWTGQREDEDNAFEHERNGRLEIEFPYYQTWEPPIFGAGGGQQLLPTW